MSESPTDQINPRPPEAVKLREKIEQVWRDAYGRNGEAVELVGTAEDWAFWEGLYRAGARG